MFKLIVLAVAAAAAIVVLRSKRSGGNGLRARAKDAGERLREAESRVEEAIRS